MQLSNRRGPDQRLAADQYVYKFLLIFKYSFGVAIPRSGLYNRRPREPGIGPIPLGIVLLKPNTPWVGFSEAIHTPRLLLAE